MIRTLRHIVLMVLTLQVTQSWSQCENYQIEVTEGFWPAEVNWILYDINYNFISSGGAPYYNMLCLDPGCYILELYDLFGDGWNGAQFILSGMDNVIIFNATLGSGGYMSQNFSIGDFDCCPDGTTSYTLEVTEGDFPFEVSWEFFDDVGTSLFSGGAPQELEVCLAPACYSIALYDMFGDGWDGSDYILSDDNGIVASGTLLDGDYELQSFAVGGASCSPTCPAGEEAYHLVVSNDIWGYEISWTLLNESLQIVGSGGSPASFYFCGSPACYTLNMQDMGGDGWGNADYTLSAADGSTIQTGTLDFGTFESNQLELGGADCGVVNPVTASDCMDAVDVCENLNFQIDPNGYGLINEIPTLGTQTNPSYLSGDGQLSPWGTDHDGCLRGGELNSTWMVVNIWQGGSLTFTFGGNGTQVGYYDWIMYPYDPDNTCQLIYNDQQPPVRCNWNFSSIGGTGLASALPPGGNAGNFEPPLNVNTGDQYLIVFSNWSSVNTVVPLDFGGTAVVGCFALVLPVDLVDLRAYNTDDAIEVAWTTRSETNNAAFEVEHSTDLVHWESLARLAGQGTTQTPHDYSIRHLHPAPGQHYYRLIQYDQNGAFRTSEYVSAMRNAPGWQIIPNPNSGVFTLVGSGPLRITDLTGRNVDAEIRVLSNGAREVTLKNSPKGVYLLHNPESGEVRRVVVE